MEKEKDKTKRQDVAKTQSRDVQRFSQSGSSTGHNRNRQNHPSRHTINPRTSLVTRPSPGTGDTDKLLTI
jgi:hypothetical protein